MKIVENSGKERGMSHSWATYIAVQLGLDIRSHETKRGVRVRGQSGTMGEVERQFSFNLFRSNTSAP